ncbi:hypothetical protein GCM10008949_38510 [Deinococcus humi]|nr:hypothetical protein GCM10008949_38510 [Deinococcus humi]
MTPTCFTLWSRGRGVQGYGVAPELIDMDDLWHIIFARQLPEEQSGGPGSPVVLQKDVRHGSMIVECSPQPVNDATDVHVYLIQVPSGTPAGFPVA